MGSRANRRKHRALGGRPKTPSGSTLIELVTALMLLGVFAAPTLEAFAQYRRRIARNEQKCAAVEVADRLLAEWAAGGWRELPQRSGCIDGRWEYRIAAGEPLTLCGHRCFRKTLQIYAVPGLPGAVPLASVDVVVNHP